MPYLTLASTIDSSRRALASRVTLALEFEGEVTPASTSTSMLWLHAVEADGGPDEVVLSYASDGTLYMGNLDLTSSANLATVGWTAVALATTVTDTWHVFQRGEHWVSAYGSGTQEVSVARVDATGFRLVREAVIATDASFLGNDHFLAASPGGAVLGVVDPAGPRIVAYKLDSDLNVVSSTPVTAVSPMTNMSSGRRVELSFGSWGQGGWDASAQARWLLVGPDSAPLVEDGVEPRENVLVGAFVDRDWLPVQPLFEALGRRYTITGQLLCMPTAIAFENDHVLVTYVRGPLGTFLCGDRGTIARALFDRTGAQEGSEEVLVADVGCRPHTVRVGDRLVTTWDEQGGGFQPLTGHARVERISLG